MNFHLMQIISWWFFLLIFLKLITLAFYFLIFWLLFYFKDNIIQTYKYIIYLSKIKKVNLNSWKIDWDQIDYAMSMAEKKELDLIEKIKNYDENNYEEFYLNKIKWSSNKILLIYLIKIIKWFIWNLMKNLVYIFFIILLILSIYLIYKLYVLFNIWENWYYLLKFKN